MNGVQSRGLGGVRDTGPGSSNCDPLACGPIDCFEKCECFEPKLEVRAGLLEKK